MAIVTDYPTPLFLDTNVFIVGAALESSPERMILNWVGYEGNRIADVENILSDVLTTEIRWVARRLQHKDWAGEILQRIWKGMNVRYVVVDEHKWDALEEQNRLPREDIGVYLSALAGNASCFVSANHELIRDAAAQTERFTCMTPEAFVATYVAQASR